MRKYQFFYRLARVSTWTEVDKNQNHITLINHNNLFARMNLLIALVLLFFTVVRNIPIMADFLM